MAFRCHEDLLDLALRLTVIGIRWSCGRLRAGAVFM